MAVMGWIFTGLLIAAVVLGLVVLAMSADDIRRYRQIKRM